MEKIGEIIKIGRVRKGLSQEELGKKLGISKNSISAWETGAKSPSCPMLFKVADILDLVPDLFPGYIKEEDAFFKIHARLNQVEKKLGITFSEE